MTSHVRLYPRQTDASLFRVEDHEAGNLVLRRDLKQEACSRCRKFDEMKALHSGAYNRVLVRIKQDFIGSWEHFPIVSARVRQVLDSVVGNVIKYFDTATGDHFIALPLHVISPDASSSSFRASNKCSKCGRYSELLWGATPFTMSSGIEVGVFHLENRMGITPVWVVTNDVRVALTKSMPKFRGFVIDPLEETVEETEETGEETGTY